MLLADLEGFSRKEISDILDIPIRYRHVTASPGKKAMQKSLWEYAVNRGLVPEGRGATMSGHECDDALTHLYQYLDQDRNHHIRVIRAHLEDCSGCLRGFDFEARLQIVVRERLAEEVHPSSWSGCLARSPARRHLPSSALGCASDEAIQPHRDTRRPRRCSRIFLRGASPGDRGDRGGTSTTSGRRAGPASGVEPAVPMTTPEPTESLPDWTYRYMIPTGIVLAVLVIVMTTIQYFTRVVRKRYRIVKSDLQPAWIGPSRRKDRRDLPLPRPTTDLPSRQT